MEKVTYRIQRAILTAIGGKRWTDKTVVTTDDLEAYRKTLLETYQADEVSFTYEERPSQEGKKIRLDIRYGIET